MPRFDELLDILKGSAVNSSFDFADALLQIPIHPLYRPKIALHTRAHKLQYMCAPFGFVNAPAELEREVNHDFSWSLNEGWMVLYMNDALVSSQTMHEHLQHLKKAVELLAENPW